MDCEPLTALLPDQSPDAEQVVAFAADQVRIELLPLLIVLGAALRLTMSTGAVTVTVADCDALPPSPVQVRSYSVVLVSAPVDHVPLVATAPLQPPEAVHAVASVEFHVNSELAPVVTVEGAAVNVTVGAGAVTTTWADCEAAPPDPVQVRV